MRAKIAHVALYTENLERMREFYEMYFGADSNDKYQEDGFSSYFLSFGNEVRFEIMTNKNLYDREIKELDTGLNHLAFSVGSRENVIELTNQLEADGYKLVSPARVTGDGYFESKILDPDGNSVEITE